MQSPSGRRLLEQIEQFRHQWPDLYDAIDLTRISGSDCSLPIAEMASHTLDFESTSQGGRGELYRHAQQNPMVRAIGIRELFVLASPGYDLRNLSPKSRILDVLGGDGTLTRALSNLVLSTSMPSILTSDLSEDMVAAAKVYGLASIRQPAQYLVLKDNCFDAVILAYGTHHIPPDQRLQVCQEAFRVLKLGGRIVLHDFENNSPVARWFHEVVDRYSLTGHNFPHFTSEEIRQYLLSAGFGDVTIRYMYDPFVLSGDSAQQVERQLGEHLLNMYGLVKLMDEQSNQHIWRSVYTLAFKYFQYDYQDMKLHESLGVPHIQVSQRESRWSIEMPRVALVGTAMKG